MKNWKLFLWALEHLEADPSNSKNAYKKCLKNDILLKLMDLSGVTYFDAWEMLHQIDDELKRREGSA